MMKRVLVCMVAVLGLVSASAFAQVNFSIGVNVGPPPRQVEVVPAARAGYVWAPGYWGWNGAQYVWVEGRWIAERPGYYWVPERWEPHFEARGPHYHFAPGHWVKGHGRWEHDDGHHRGRG